MIKLKTVPDTNIIIALHSNNPQSPNKEYYRCWHNNEFDLLYSDDTLFEFAVKLKQKGLRGYNGINNQLTRQF